MAEASPKFLARLGEYDYVRFTVADIQGQSRGKIIPKRHAAGYLEHGPDWWIGLIGLGPNCETPMHLKCLGALHHSNCRCIPDLSTLHPVPWAGHGKYKVGSIICETSWIHDDKPQDACPRYVARKQLDKLSELGYTFLSGIEHEFMLHEKGTRKPEISGNHFCSSHIQGQYEPFLFDLDTALTEAGVNVQTLQSEYAAGQFEFTCKPQYGMQTADESFIFKEAVKEISEQKGYDYCFLSKPAQDVGNGSHFNFSLWDEKKEKNVFHDPDDPDKLSDVCRYFIGGLIKHTGALTALCSPTVNCYRRLHLPWAADLANWGVEDRLTSFRVKNYSKTVTLIENRVPGGPANPYIVTAATIAAGIDGIKHKMAPPPMHQTDAPRLPNTLEEALDALEKDRAMVESLGPEFVEWFVETKREFEVKPLKGFNPKVFDDGMLEKEMDLYYGL